MCACVCVEHVRACVCVQRMCVHACVRVCSTYVRVCLRVCSACVNGEHYQVEVEVTVSLTAEHLNPRGATQLCRV